ncbi:MAG TPA: hypothetical protein PK759_01415 [Spirochaetales bacterium]|nr:hypothetical protein [Spirochaetales bacterium]HPS14437.1 hypothetical protein [Spirochaetales bacterium]
MLQLKKVFCVVILLVVISAVSADSGGDGFWSDTFLGVSWDFGGSFVDKTVSFQDMQIDDLSLFFTYGRRTFTSLFPLRARLGIGWWKGQPWVASLGVEVPVYEQLSESQAKHFGVYLFGDGHFRFPVSGNRFSFEPSLRLLLPLTGAGGIAIGAGYDTALGPTWHVELMNGAYVVR